jgi:hypothetical protein
VYLYNDPEKKPLVAQPGDRLIYEIRHSLLQYARPNSGPIQWREDDDKKLISPRLLHEGNFFNFAEALAEMAGLHCRWAGEDWESNPSTAGRFWVVEFY